MQVQIAAIARDDSGGFLPAMLQRVQAEIGELRRFFVSEDAEHTTFVMETVVSESELLRHSAIALRALTRNRKGIPCCYKR